MSDLNEEVGGTERGAAEPALKEWVKPEFRRIELKAAAGVTGNETPADGYSNT